MFAYTMLNVLFHLKCKKFPEIIILIRKEIKEVIWTPMEVPQLSNCLEDQNMTFLQEILALYTCTHTCTCMLVHACTYTHTHYYYLCTLASSTEAFQDREKNIAP